MKFGQFCGFLADEMDFQHSDFVLGAELLFTMGASDEAGELAVSFPDRNVTATDAAMFLCLSVAIDLGASDPSQAAETAQEIGICGQNMPILLSALGEGHDAAIDISGRFAATLTVPGSLISKIKPLLRGGNISHLRSI